MAPTAADCADSACAGCLAMGEREAQVIYGAYICIIVAAILAIACMPAGSVDDDKRGGK